MSFHVTSANVAVGNTAGNIHCFRAMPDGNLYIGRDTSNVLDTVVISGNLNVQGRLIQTSLTKSDIGLGNVIDALQIAASEKAVANGVASLDANGILASAQRFTVTKADVGLGNVLDIVQIPASQKAAANGVATLNSIGQVPIEQLPNVLTQNIGIPLSEKGAPEGVASLDATGKLSNIHWFTKTDIGLGNVVNALQIVATEKAVANGVASLDANGILTSSQRFSLTKSQIGLGNVSDFLQIAASEKAVANGVATLDANGILTSSQRFSLTKSQVGLGNVIDALQIVATEKGVANGVATLDANAQLTASQLPNVLSNINGTTASRVLVTNSSNAVTTSNVSIAQLETVLTGNSFSVNAANVTGNLDGLVVLAGDIDANLLVGNTSMTINFTPGTIPGDSLYGSVLGNVGNVSAPGFTFLGNTSTGLYLANTTTIGISTGGTQRAQINPQGLFVSSNIIGFTGNTSVGISLSNNMLSSSTNIQVPAGVVTAMNTSTAITGSMPGYINALGCSVHSGNAAGVSTGIVTPSIGGFAAQDGLTLWKNPSTLYDFWRTYVNLAAGTYTFRLHAPKASDRGVITVVVGSTAVGNIDLYGTYADGINDLTGVVIPSSTVYKVELQCNSKNASASGYTVAWRGASFIRTA